MNISRLDIHNVRNIHAQTIYPNPQINFIYGKNASGKSALIEAIFLLGRAKSFRSSGIKPVIRFGQDHLTVSAQVLQQNGTVQQLGIQMDGNGVEIRINQQKRQKRSDLAYSLPLQIIHPKSFELLDGSSQLRREFLDWGIFNNDERFLPAWRNYKKALLQRNAALKKKAVSQLQVWDQELVNYGTIVTTYREGYLQKFKPVLADTIARFFKPIKVDIRFISGWGGNKEPAQLLVDDVERDLRDGFTHSGPHRDDFQLLVNGKIARDTVSRGQLKLLVICLKLAQVELILREKGINSCILIDDFAAELDKETRLKSLKQLYEMKCQVFITATEKQEFGDLSFIENHLMFHVEHGEFKAEDVSRGT